MSIISTPMAVFEWFSRRDKRVVAYYRDKGLLKTKYRKYKELPDKEWENAYFRRQYCEACRIAEASGGKVGYPWEDENDPYPSRKDEVPENELIREANWLGDIYVFVGNRHGVAKLVERFDDVNDAINYVLFWGFNGEEWYSIIDDTRS